MSAILTFIEEAIDVPLMDVKNIAPIIEGYCKYLVFEETDISSLTLEVNCSADNDFRGEEKRFIVSDEAYYVLENAVHSVKFEKGEPIFKAGHTQACFKETPDSYLFIRNDYGIVMWRITRKFSSNKAFNEYGSRQLAKWARIYKAPLLLNDRYINIIYDDTYIFSGYEEDDVPQFTSEIAKQVYDTFFI